MHNFKLLASGVLTALFLFAAICSAQTITIISGDGQFVCPNCPGAPGRYTPLVVQVKDSTGAPAAAGTTVTWVVTQPGFPTITATSATDSTGQASYNFQGPGFFYGSNFLPTTVAASALNTSVTFVETTTQPAFGTAPVSITLIPYGAAPKLTGAVGSTGGTPIKVQITPTVYSLPLQGIAVSLQSGTAGQPTVSCSSVGSPQAGTVFTDATGVATCSPVFGGAIGTGTYTIVVGGAYATFPSATLTVTAGPAAAIKYISGNNQLINPGNVTPSPLTAEVTDLGGNAVKSAAVTWTVSPAGGATLSGTVSTSSSTGFVSTKVSPIAGPGPILVTVALTSNKAVQYTFTVKVNTVITALQAVSSLTEATKVNTAFPDPIIVQANASNVPVPGVTVSFAATSGVTLSAASAVTNAQGQAQITATAGAAAGQATVTASVTASGKTYSQVFTLTINPLGAVITAITNAAGFQSQFVSPCSLATIFGTGLADNIQGVVASFIEPQPLVAGVSVKFNGVSAPILDVANENGQQSASVQVPCEMGSLTLPASVNMVVTVDGTDSPAFPVSVSTYSPGIFEAIDPVDGVLRAVLVRPDGSFVSVANPARRGEVIRMWATGLGQTSPALFTNEFDPLVPDTNGNLVPQALAVQASLVVGVNNSGVSVLWANYAYGMVGVYEVAFQVPQDTTPGNNAPFAIAVVQGNNLLFGNGSKLPIQ